MIFFGGTFDPVHSGHYNLLKTALDLQLEGGQNAIVIPAVINPHKQNKKFQTAFRHRFAMCHIMFSDLIAENKVILSNIEKTLPQPSFTMNTLSKLQSICKDPSHINEPHYLLLGYDSFLSLPRWHKSDWMLNSLNFIVGARDNETCEYDFQVKNRVIFLNNELWPVSATQLRQQLSDLKLMAVKKWLTTPVIDYIENTGIYMKNSISGSCNNL